jgi:histidinol-phosphate aminotransferase
MPESAANFVFAKPPKGVPAGLLYKNLREKGILVRYFDKDVLRDYLRITIGTDEEMRALVEACTEEIKNVQNS